MIATLLLLLALLDQTAEAKQLLDALAPKNADFAQLEFEVNGKTGTGYFAKQRAYRVDSKKGDLEVILLWDGALLTNYTRKSNRFFKTPKPSKGGLTLDAGGLAEIYFSGGSERLLAGATGVTVKKEKLGDVDCSHVWFGRDDFLVGATGFEMHFWIDAEKNCRRYTLKYNSRDKPVEQTFAYKVIDPPTGTKSVFEFRVPADAKDIGK
jgi:hypothetical protein